MKAKEVCQKQEIGVCWIGADKSSGAWRWTDNSPWDYEDWLESHPRNDEELAYLNSWEGQGWASTPHFFVAYEVVNMPVQFAPLCGEECVSVLTSGYFWSSLNGVWNEVEGVTKNGQKVYKKENWSHYMWFLIYTDGYPYWVIGNDYRNDWYFAYRFGDNLFDACDNKWCYCGTWWVMYHQDEWLHQPTCCRAVDLRQGCPASLNAASDMGIEWDGAIPNGTNYIRTPEALRSSAVFPYVEITVGSAIGAAVIVALVIAIIFKKKKMNKSDDAKRDGAHHVAELSPSDIMADGVKVVTTEEVTKKESVAVTEVATVSVVEVAAQIPEDGAVNAE